MTTISGIKVCVCAVDDRLTCCVREQVHFSEITIVVDCNYKVICLLICEQILSNHFPWTGWNFISHQRFLLLSTHVVTT